MSVMYTDGLFAPLDKDLHLERIGGGNETEVYCTDDRRFVVKVKSEEQQTPQEALRQVQQARAAATAFAAAVGPQHSIPSYYLVARNSEGAVQPVVLQPYLCQAQSLFELDYEKLSAPERQHLAGQLRQIIRRSLDFYRQTGQLPDLYGRTSRSKADRKRLNRLWMLPWRLWSFLVKRNLLRAHNLMLTEAPERRVVLIDYDSVQRSQLYRFVYYNVRRFLFWRDYLLLWIMEKTGYVPKA
ncbi:MAG TPA: hypothetical protein VEC96_04025 [Anaerolineae bacterium]|nr:hypothetical protein [Anaerolineae bacterium]